MSGHDSHDPFVDQDQRKHEPDSMRVGAVAWAALALAALTIITAVLMTGVDDLLFTESRKTLRAGRTTMQPQQVVAATPLDPTQPTELRELRAAEEQILTTYGWIDRKTPIARIPIDRAIRLMAERGLSRLQIESDTTSSRKSKTAKPGAQLPREEK